MRSLFVALIFLGLLAPLRADSPPLKCSNKVQFQSQARLKLFHDIMTAPPGVGTLDLVFFPTATGRDVAKIEVIALLTMKDIGEEVWTVSHPDGQLAYYRVRMKIIKKDMADRTPYEVEPNNYAIQVQRLKHWPVPKPATP